METTPRGTKIHPNWAEEYIKEVLQAEEFKGRAICGAKNRRGVPCNKRPLANGRCRLHGGASTGPGNQVGNTNAVKHGLRAESLKEKIYRQIYGTDPSIDNPIVRLARLNEITAGLFYKFISEQEIKSTEQLDQIIRLTDQLVANDSKLYYMLQKEEIKILQNKITPEELDSMSAEARLKYINNLKLYTALLDSRELADYYEVLTKGLKAEGDLSNKKDAANIDEDIVINVRLKQDDDSDDNA